MKKSAKVALPLIFCFIISSINLVNAEPSWIMWSETYGGSSKDTGSSMVRTSDGGYALAGYTFSFGAGSADAWLIKTDGLGHVEWNQTYGGTDFDRALSLVRTSDGGFAMGCDTWSYGAGQYDFWLVKTDGSGDIEWNQTYGRTRYEVVSSLVETSDGGYALVGYTSSFGAGDDDVWLVKTDVLGNMEWNHTYGGGQSDWGRSVMQTNDGGYAIVGRTSSFGAGGSDVWLIKTDVLGNIEWNQTYGGTGNDDAYSLIKTSDGGFALAGATESFGVGSWDFWLVKTDSTGNIQWSKTYGGTGWDIAFSVVQTNDGGYALTGETRSYGYGNDDVWLVKTDGSGNIEWNRNYGGEVNDRAYSLVEVSGGGFALAGETESFGAGDYDVWLIRTNEQGVPEFPSWTPISLILIVLAVVIAIYKRRLIQNTDRLKSYVLCLFPRVNI